MLHCCSAVLLLPLAASCSIRCCLRLFELGFSLPIPSGCLPVAASPSASTAASLPPWCSLCLCLLTFQPLLNSSWQSVHAKAFTLRLCSFSCRLRPPAEVKLSAQPA